jgi:hypothetical protein
MAEYKDIKGFKVQTVSTDPAASIIATGTWASGGNLNTARASWIGGTPQGTQNAAIFFGGNHMVLRYALHRMNTYNGSSWTEVS